MQTPTYSTLGIYGKEYAMPFGSCSVALAWGWRTGCWRDSCGSFTAAPGHGTMREGRHSSQQRLALSAAVDSRHQSLWNNPALMIGDLVKLAGLAPSQESLFGALREAGLE